jgi:hypothetical protein
VRDLEVSPPTEDEAHRVRQVAAIARAWSRPALALPSLVEWLERFPDAAESGPAWLDLAMTALRAGPSHGARAARALTRARALLGDVPVVRRADSLLTAGRARSTFA